MWRMAAALLVALGTLGMAACSGDDDDSGAAKSAVTTAIPTTTPGSGSPATTTTTTTASPATSLSISSSAFQDGGTIPRDYSCDGRNVSPPLAFGAPPTAAKGLVLLVEDPDAPRGTFDHWVVYAIPTEVRGFPEAASPSRTGLPGNAFEGVNGSGKAGYTGPCPPAGPAHGYIFHLYAVDAPLAIGEGRSKAEVQAAMRGHVLAEATLTGKYGR